MSNSSNGLTFRIINEREKKIELNYKGKTLRFQLRKKRSFTVLRHLLESYPNFLNIHDLDSILHDPNRAHSDLRNDDGFASFLIEEKRGRGVMHDAKKLFEFVREPENPEQFIHCVG